MADKSIGASSGAGRLLRRPGVATLMIVLVAMGGGPAANRGVHAAASIPPPLPTSKNFLDPHNAARALVRVAPLAWNSTLAAFALGYGQKQRDFHDCDLEHSRGPYGENLFWGSSVYFTAADAVGSWVGERQFYDYRNNSCAAAEECGHYTQVVWRRSSAVGCAAVPCRDGAIFMICSYYPPGNVVGARPY